jgi:dolichol kinase
MKKVSMAELNRKIIHLGSVLIPIGYLWYVKEQNKMILILICLSMLSIAIDYLRNKLNILNSFFNFFFTKMLRKSELDGKTTGATWLLLGSLLTVIFFPIYIAVPSLIYLTVGDSFAALVGKTFPYGRVGNKSITGTLTGIVFSSIVALKLNKVLPFELIILGSVVAMLIELFPHHTLNDNLTIPVLSAFSIQMAFYFL